eukprot:CAMPEP_0197247126 /NCGR_PEP_ID=MMETSP1429-20130617/26121_1 /TAXON_ID=49237 /ORGANISM="Chaetoceros  sp., Strain UNC1202" /LENGTH=187 /DNA_ID=CAMNT_0042707959 /DNA_START=107 /DNA_END=670 /DNA_ORIENTATION=-
MKQYLLLLLVVSIFVTSVNADDIKGYCAKPCTDSDDPCGDGKGQTASCQAATFSDSTLFGYDASSIPKEFIGCSHSACGTSCAAMDPESMMDIVDGTFCFPKKSMMDGMYGDEDLTKMAAISRGCSGSHEMNDKFMVGGMHGDCASSYNYAGVKFEKTSATSTSARMRTSLLMACAAVTASWLVATI